MSHRIKLCVLACVLVGVSALSVLPQLLNTARAAAGKPASTRVAGAQQPAPAATCRDIPPLPLPSSFLPGRLPAFQEQLARFLQCRQYANLDWAEDKGVRDTGPYVSGNYYGVHPAVKIYYSPQVVRWLQGGRSGAIPDGAMIVKEQFPPPAGRYRLDAPPPVSDWTVMIKDAKGSADGWYWAEIWDKQCADNNDPPFAVRNAGFGLYCVRCHASAEHELTFSSLANIEGHSGEPLHYYDDNSWFYAPVPAPTPTPTPPPPCRETGGHTAFTSSVHHDPGARDEEEHKALALLTPPPVHAGVPDPQFIAFYDSIRPVNSPKKLPGESLDHVFAKPAPPGSKTNLFLTSDSCMGCHSGITYSGNVMLYEGRQQPDGTTPAMNVSPVAEWRWSPMGLAGRDPIFYAQLDSEIAYLKTQPNAEVEITKVTNTCFKCHGVMGKRTLDIDHGGTDKGDFKRDYVYITDENDPNFKYGALARDGISCMSCHRIIADKTPPGVPALTHFLEKAITGEFTVGSADELTGPFKDNEIVTDPMHNALGVKPKYDPYIKSGRMCGSCHTINLPVMDYKQPPQQRPDEPPRPVTHSSLEQLTYLEWLNSGYQNEYGGGPRAETCQDCHMRSSYSNAKGTLSVPLIRQPIAAIEDDRYPATEGMLSPDKTHVRLRESGFARHQLQGLNIPLLEMFRQYMEKGYANGANLLANPILGVRQNDYMQLLADNLPNAVDAFIEQAANSTAEVKVAPISISAGKLAAEVLVTNKTGHRFPSGVGFRRSFLELRVVDSSSGQEKTVWCSGCTNELGVITNGDGGKPLPSELFDKYQAGQKPDRENYPAQCKNVTPQHYQPHFWGMHFPITRQDQAQVYEEIDLNADCAVTSSFIRRDFVIKDNRLLPFGWTEQGPLGSDGRPVIPKEFLEPTHAEGVWDDPRYTDGSGTSLVRYEVALPPGVNPNNLTVRATLYYQSIPPHYLHDRFTQAPDYPATQRLYYLTSNLRARGTPMENWKVKVVAASRLAG
jgi:hypothetical protein